MKNQIKILLLFLSYMLSFAHDMIPHNHIPPELCCGNSFLKQSLNHLFYQHKDTEKESNNCNDESHKNDCKLPFQHSHILLSHDYSQIRSEFSVNYFPVLYFITNQFVISNQTQKFPKLNTELIIPNKKQIELESINSFRAPPNNFVTTQPN